MKEYPFEHDSPVYLICDDTIESCYYARDGKKYRRVRDTERFWWDIAKEEEIDDDIFWMTIACIQRSYHHA